LESNFERGEKAHTIKEIIGNALLFLAGMQLHAMLNGGGLFHWIAEKLKKLDK
jgi:hypothetical protein